MRRNLSEQVWLTFALIDADVQNALVLCFSLRRAATSRKVAVIVSHGISKSNREALEQSFDFVFSLQEDRNTIGMKNKDFVKIYALTLKNFTKCVMLDPNMMVMKNCDELFDAAENDQYYTWTRNQDLSIVEIQPSLHEFHRLVTDSENNNELYSDLITILLRNKPSRYIDGKYNRSLLDESEMLLGNEKDISIVKLPEQFKEGSATETLGMVAQLVERLWKSIQSENVQPLLAFTKPSNALYDELKVSYKPDAIAIVGMACRYPGADSLEEYWNILFEGKDTIGIAPEFRWPREHCPKHTKPGYRQTKAGFLKCPVDDFDSSFFGIRPKDIVAVDPQQRLLHKLVWEGLEDAAIDSQSLEGTNGGVFIGSWTNDYKDMMTLIGADNYYRRYLGNSIGAGASRISYMLGLTGPSIATESGCSSAMVAVHLACKSLERGEINLALACGVNLLLFPFDKETISIVQAPDGRSKTFDAKADGFARAEGAGVLVLKRVSDAVRDGDRIWGLIRGSAMTHEGISKSMGTPSVHCESLAMKQALQDANVDPAMVSYVETHGTGTAVGDPIEVAAIARAYHSGKREEPLLIGSVKTNVGHTESCSGIAGIMKVTLSMKHEAIPPHINFETLNPAIDINAVPARIPLELVSWSKRQGAPRIAGVSSFGITGTDAHVIIEEPPSFNQNPLKCSGLERPLQIMKISAKTDEALDTLLENYKSHLSTTDDELSDLAYTANIGRTDFSRRAIIIAKSKEAAIKMIETGKILGGESVPEALGKTCFLFTGQGSQYPGMGKTLYETSPVFRMHFEYCQKLLKNNYNIDISKILWSPSNADEVSRTIYSQTSIFCLEYALFKLWESWGVKPDFVLGHSLGEFAAAVAANILRVEDALKLVAERSRLIDELPRGKMLVIKADKERVGSLMHQFICNNPHQHMEIAAINSPEQTVVAGDSELVLNFGEVCKNSNLKCIVLEATHAFHTKHMDPMLDEYRRVAQSVKNLGGSSTKYISGMMGTVVEADQVGSEYWVEHTREKVSFLDASRKAVELECRTFIEIGPQPVLSALTMINNDFPLLCWASLKRNECEWETLLQTLGKYYVKGGKVNWDGFDQFLEREKVRLPHYPFMGKPFWADAQQAIDSVVLHPLLGSALANPSPTKLFTSGLNLRAIEYVKDHVIGDKIIFPGAGFLEMCLAGGWAAVSGSTSSFSAPSRAFKIQNLTIRAPLCLEESKTCQLQTMVELLNMSQKDDGGIGDIKVSIFRKIDTGDSRKWLPHATTSFSLVLTEEEKLSAAFDTTAFFQTLDQQPSDQNLLQEMYERLTSVGLKFGPAFRSLENIWRDEERGTILARVKIPPIDDASAQYIIHPVVLDAMIQTILMLRFRFSADLNKKKLYMPIKIGKFLWLSAPESGELYIQSFKSNPADTAILVDSTGKVLAKMSSVDIIETTVKAVESVLEQQTDPMPDLFQEVWKPSLGVHQHRVDLLKLRVNIEELGIIPDDCNTPPAHVDEVFSELERLVYLHMLRSLYQRGWEPASGQIFGEKALAQQLGIMDSYLQYFGFMVSVLESEGILEKQEEIELTWKVISQPLSLEETMRILSSPGCTTELTLRFSTTPLFNKVGEALGEILAGKQPALPILFHDGSSGCPTVSDFYTTCSEFLSLRNSIKSKLGRWLEHFRRITQGGKSILRILEIGGGTGVFTDMVLGVFEAEGLEFEYTFTDISPAFFSAAEKRFEKSAKKMKFKKFNIEEDPFGQGFRPAYYDMVLASDVIHTTKDIRVSLKNIRLVMKPNARLDIVEMTRVNRFITFMFGLLDGFWRFRDYDIRPNHCKLSQQNWRMVLNQVGFEVDALFPIVNDHHSYIWAVRTAAQLETPQFHKKAPCWLIFQQNHADSQISSYLKERLTTASSRRVLTVQPGDTFERSSEAGFRIRKEVEEDYDLLFKSLNEEQVELEGIVYCWALDSFSVLQEDILRPYFYVTKTLLELARFPRLLTLTSGAVPAGDGDVTNFPLGAIWGFTKSLINESTGTSIKILDIEPGPCNEQQCEEVFQEMWNFDKEPMLAHREGARYIPKLQAHKATMSPLKLPPYTDRFQLILPDTKSISDLVFGPLEHSSKLEENEVEVQVKAAALNFRDVLAVLKPTEQFKDFTALAFDIAGVVKRVGEKVTKFKVGDRVSGCNTENNALPSHVRVNQEMLAIVPEHITLCEAATIPIVYATSVLFLLETAKIKKEDVVLIHTATGGVGLSAIEICKHVGCSIIATAGSKRKRNYLRSLGIKHVFHSRTIAFGDQILEVTNGRGVDVVLNSLPSQGFKETTLKACAKGARFLEMSKINVWKAEEVKQLRPDVDYRVVDIGSGRESDWFRWIGVVRELTEKGVAKPIPYVRFDGLHIREALRYMQKAKHIGKIVCVMPEVRNEVGEMRVTTPMFNERSSYLITGGLGGIGFVVTEWMLEKGAKHVILAGRSLPSPSLQNKVKELNAGGANVVVVQLDVGNFDQCRGLLQTQISQQGLPPLRGVMHAAGILSDGFITKQEWGRLRLPFDAKVDGTLNLHELTKHLNLEHFVMFSSLTALIGPPGQCNHSAATNFEDAFAHYRHSIGLPATSINWGQWGEVGVATEVDFPGLKTISNLQGMTALEYALNSQRTQLAVVNVESFYMMTKLYSFMATYVDERILKSSYGSSSVTLKATEFWRQFDSISEPEGRLALVKTQLKLILKESLKLDEHEEVNEDADFDEMGVDSLMFVEIKNSLQALLGERLVVNASGLKECKTINLLATALIELIEGNEEEKDLTLPTLDEVNELIRKDCVLPDHITAKPEQVATSLKDVRVILIAGVTGTLGPYLLKELSNSHQIEQVVCLVRPRTNEKSVDERLQKILAKKGLLHQVNKEKVKIVSGNVALAKLGMEAEVWNELSWSVDAVFNCAVLCQHGEIYRKRTSTTDSRAVNIGGMKNLLEFAVAGKLKRFCHASSMVAVTTIDTEEGTFKECWPEIGDFDNVTKHVYPVTKFVGDYLAKVAVERGIPVKVFRFPIITGEEKTGRRELGTNHPILRYIYIMKSGCIQSTPIPVVALPVDTCADAWLRLFFDDRASSELYNVGPAKPVMDQNFVEVAKRFGHEVEIVELEEFMKRVAEDTDDKSALKPFQEVYKESESVLSSLLSVPSAIQCKDGLDKFRSSKVEAIIPNFYDNQPSTMEFIYKDLLFLKEQGVLKKFGL